MIASGRADAANGLGWVGIGCLRFGDSGRLSSGSGSRRGVVPGSRPAGGHSQFAGWCSRSRRADRETRAGMLMMRARMVAVVALVNRLVGHSNRDGVSGLGPLGADRET